MNRTYKLVVAAIASAPAVAGLALSAPATAAPDLGHQVCSAIDRQGASLRTFLQIETELIQKARYRAGQAVEAVRESVNTDCPQYQAAFAQADSQAQRELDHINGNY
jgi:hypothetical protein